MTRFRSIASALIIAAVAGCSGDQLVDTGLPAPDDPSLMRRAVILDIDLVNGTVSARTPHAAPRLTGSGPLAPSFALLGHNEVDISINNYTRGQDPHEAANDRIMFDVSIVNRLLNADLVTPSFPAPPPNRQGIFLVPFAAMIAPASLPRPVLTAEWDGAPWNFFNDKTCSTGASSDCFRYEPFAVVGPGETSEERTVAFSLRRQAISLSVYMIVAADIVERPIAPGTGVIAGHLSGLGIGPMANIQVGIAGTTHVTQTDNLGYYAFTGVPEGPVALDFSGAPAYCDNPAQHGATVTAGNLTTIDKTLSCYGNIAGSVNASQGGPYAGIFVASFSVGTNTLANGTYLLQRVRAGQQFVAVSQGIPTGCSTPAQQTTTVIPGQTVVVNFAMSCLIFGTVDVSVNAGSDLLKSYPVTLKQTGQPDRLGTTNTSGHVQFTNVPVGFYTIVTPANGGCAAFSGANILNATFQSMPIFVNCPAFSITTTSLPAGKIYNLYHQGLQSTIPATWSIVPGSTPLHNGLGLFSNNIDGTPTEFGSRNITVQAMDPLQRVRQATISLFIANVPADGYEPNNSLGQAFFAGEALEHANPGLSIAGWSHLPGTQDEDWYVVRFREEDSIDFCFGSESFHSTVVLNVPAGEDYDLFVYNSGGSLVGQSTLGSGQTDAVGFPWSGGCFQRDQIAVWVKVVRFSGPVSGTPYTLRFVF